MKTAAPVTVYEADAEFVPEKHFYTKVLNSQLHSAVRFFYGMSTKRIINRYTHLYPSVNRERLEAVLRKQPREMRWSGADLMFTTTESGRRNMVIIETNSCPSGQKSFPQLDEESDDRNGYGIFMKRTVVPWMTQQKDSGNMIEGVLAVIYDKNDMEAHGYAVAMAQEMHERVYVVQMFNPSSSRAELTNGNWRWSEDLRVLSIRVPVVGGADDATEWVPVRACFRYVTQQPWNRLSLVMNGPRTLFVNPVIACLSGGRNKLVADKAYELWNSQHADGGLHVRTPETIRDVYRNEVPLWVRSMGGKAVVKVPYGNAGQGVYTLINEAELQAFMEAPVAYDQLIVQALLGNRSWSSNPSSSDESRYQVGMLPDKKGNIYVNDLRMMISYDYTAGVYKPIALYGRRAAKPLSETLDQGSDSWAMLGTNLSVAEGDNTWSSDTSRLLLMDTRDFNRLGLSIDDLIDAYVQTVFAVSAIDDMVGTLSGEGTFNVDLFRSLNNDPSLLSELLDSQ